MRCLIQQTDNFTFNFFFLFYGTLSHLQAMACKWDIPQNMLTYHSCVIHVHGSVLKYHGNSEENRHDNSKPVTQK